MANVDMFNSGIDVPMKSEVFTLGGMGSVSPSLDLSNYSNLLPFGNQDTGLNFEPGGYDTPFMFPEETPSEVPNEQGFPMEPAGDMFPQMFPSEIPNQSFGDMNQNYSENFQENQFASDNLLQTQNKEFEMMSLDATQLEQNTTQRNPMMEFIDKTPLPNSAQGVAQNQQTPPTEQQTTAPTTNQFSNARNPVTIPASVRNKDTKTPIKASAGYEGDIANFFEEIKNPPMWRVLG